MDFSWLSMDVVFFEICNTCFSTFVALDCYAMSDKDVALNNSIRSSTLCLNIFYVLW